MYSASSIFYTYPYILLHIHHITGAVISVLSLEEDANAFGIESSDKTRRYFRSTTPSICEEWVRYTSST